MNFKYLFMIALLLGCGVKGKPVPKRKNSSFKKFVDVYHKAPKTKEKKSKK